MAGAVCSAPPSTAVEAYIAARGWLDQEKFLTRGGGARGLPFAATANLVIRRDVFEAVGPFDPGLKTAGEDADWCWRAAELGHAIEYVPDATVLHRHRADLRGMLRQAYHYGLGNADLFAKHRGEWGMERSIEWRWWIWSAKGLARWPWDALTGRTRAERLFGLYDFLANAAQGWGRWRGGRRRGVFMI
jgi:GT2 family glycosyltransferase